MLVISKTSLHGCRLTKTTKSLIKCYLCWQFTKKNTLPLKKTTVALYEMTASQKESLRKWIDCLLEERSKSKSVWCTQRQKWKFLSREEFNYLRCPFEVHLPCSQHEAKIRVNHTWCCLIFKRNELSHPAAMSLRCPVDRQRGLWMHC